MELIIKLIFSEDWDIYADMDAELIVEDAIRELAEGVTYEIVKRATENLTDESSSLHSVRKTLSSLIKNESMSAELRTHLIKINNKMSVSVCDKCGTETILLKNGLCYECTMLKD